jgi:hypothetical protein
LVEPGSCDLQLVLPEEMPELGLEHMSLDGEIEPVALPSVVKPSETVGACRSCRAAARPPWSSICRNRLAL